MPPTMDDPDELLGLAERDDDPVPGIADERLEAMLEWALRSDAEPDATLVPPGAGPFGEEDGAGDAAPWRTEEGGGPGAGEPLPADDTGPHEPAAEAFGPDSGDWLDHHEDADPGEHDGGEPWSVDS